MTRFLPCADVQTCEHIVHEEVDEAIALWFTPPRERTESGEALLHEVMDWNPCAQQSFIFRVQADPRTAEHRFTERESVRDL